MYRPTTPRERNALAELVKALLQGAGIVVFQRLAPVSSHTSASCLRVG